MRGRDSDVDHLDEEGDHDLSDHDNEDNYDGKSAATTSNYWETDKGDEHHFESQV